MTRRVIFEFTLNQCAKKHGFKVHSFHATEVTDDTPLPTEGWCHSKLLTLPTEGWCYSKLLTLPTEGWCYSKLLTLPTEGLCYSKLLTLLKVGVIVSC